MKIRMSILVMLVCSMMSLNAIVGADESQLTKSTPQVSQEIDTEQMIVEGLAPLDADGGIAAARKLAIDSALSLAVEQRLGATIVSEREAINHILTRSRISKMVQGEIAKYQILEEGTQDGTYRVKLAVELRRDQVLRLGLDQVRIATLLRGGDLSSPCRDVVMRGIEKNLAHNGMLLTSLTATGKDEIMDKSRLQDLADQNGADLILIIDTRQQAKKSIGGLQLGQSELSARLYRGMTGDLILSTSALADGQRASELDESLREAFGRAADQLGQDLIRGLAQRFDGLLVRRVLVTGLPTRTEVDRIEKALLDVKGIRQIMLDQFKGHIALWTLELEPEAARRLADRLQHIQGVDLDVTEEASGWLTARMPLESGGVHP